MNEDAKAERLRRKEENRLRLEQIKKERMNKQK